MSEEIDISQLPQPPEGSPFELWCVETLFYPHPYCITPKHLKECDSGILDERSIELAEKRGAHCGVKGCNLSFKKHASQKALLIKVPQNKDLNAVEGLSAYLLSIRDKAEELGIEGFAFPAE